MSAFKISKCPLARKKSILAEVCWNKKGGWLATFEKRNIVAKNRHFNKIMTYLHQNARLTPTKRSTKTYKMQEKQKEINEKRHEINKTDHKNTQN